MEKLRHHIIEVILSNRLVSEGYNEDTIASCRINRCDTSCLQIIDGECRSPPLIEWICTATDEDGSRMFPVQHEDGIGEVVEYCRIYETVRDAFNRINTAI